MDDAQYESLVTLSWFSAFSAGNKSAWKLRAPRGVPQRLGVAGRWGDVDALHLGLSAWSTSLEWLRSTLVGEKW